MVALRNVWFSIVLALVFLIPVVPVGERTETQPAVVLEDQMQYVRVDVPLAESASLGPGVEVVERYEGFVVARATEDAVARLSGRGITVVQEDLFSLRVNGYAFDTRLPVQVPAALAAASLVEGYGYEIVQFHGPVKDEWRWTLEGYGPQVVAYIPNNAYLVRVTPAQLAAVRELPQVQWTGAYHPAFRISPDLLTSEGMVTVKVILHAGESVAPVVATLNKMGIPMVGRWASDPGIYVAAEYPTFGLVRVSVDAEDLVRLAQLPGVRYIEPEVEMKLFNQQEQFVLQTNASVDGPGVRRIWDQGLRGELSVIALSDTGLDYDHSMYRHSAASVTLGSGATSIYNQTNTARRKVIRYFPMSSYLGVDPFTGGDPQAIQDSPGIGCFGGSGHGTSTSSAAAGDDLSPTIGTSLNDGMAPGAKLVMLDIGSCDPTTQSDILVYIPDDYSDLFGPAYAAPTNARIFSNSWGT
ncbi:MAG TPA: S8 family serine peptidase, partial [Thermoplasmata archaeon]